MTTAEARALIAHPSLGQGAAQTWADLGCGRGTFTRALASLLPGGSTIHAADTDRAALDALPGEEHGIRIVAHAADVTAEPWPFDGLDGVLMANSLHFLRNQDAFLTRLVAAMPKPMLISSNTTPTRAIRGYRFHSAASRRASAWPPPAS